MPRPRFRVLRNGQDIREAGVKGGVNPGISYGMEFAGYEAAVAAGLDLWKWESRQYSRDFMVKIVAWFNLHNLVSLHSEAAAQEAAEKKSKQRGG